MPYKNKEIQKQYQKQWMQKRREKFLVDKQCQECASKDYLTFVNFKNEVISFSYKNIEEKLKNCTILCEECFRHHSRNLRKIKSTTHGDSIKSGSQAYNSWDAMKQRCTNPNAENYRWYGERGITYCKRWEKYENFLEDMGEKPEGMSLDRIDPNGNYEPNNCRWATWEQQGLNKRKKFFDKEKQRN